MAVRKAGKEVVERNFAKEPLTRGEVESIVSAAGSVAAVMNARHEIARTRGWQESPPSKDDFVAAVLKEHRLMRRPILVAGKRVVVGNVPTEIRRALA